MLTQLNETVQELAQSYNTHLHMTVQQYTRPTQHQQHSGWLVVQAAQRGVREAVLERQTVTRAILGLAELHDLQSECRYRRQ